MKVLSIGFPRSVFPFRSISQRFSLEYDEIDEAVDEALACLFEDASIVHPEDPGDRVAADIVRAA